MAKHTQIAFDFDSFAAASKESEAEVAPAIVVEKNIDTANEIIDVTAIAEVAIEEAPEEIEEEAVEIVEAPALKKTSNKKQTRGRMSLKDMQAGTDLIEVPDDVVLFEKMYYSIGAVSDMFKVNQSLIRFWENEFDVLKPKKNGKGDRLFRPEDVKNLKLIYHLLRERKYTIEGAKEFIKNNKKADEKFAMIESMKKLKGFLNELKANL